MPWLGQSHTKNLLVEKGSIFFDNFALLCIHVNMFVVSFFDLQNNLMPNGEANVTGNVFEILHADRHSAGHYRCSADNRVGTADTREIFVNVLCKRSDKSFHRHANLSSNFFFCFLQSLFFQ
jgi:hypothetical protein